MPDARCARDQLAGIEAAASAAVHPGLYLSGGRI